MIAAPFFGWCVGAFGVRAALWALAAMLGATGALSAWLIARSGATPRAAGRGGAPGGPGALSGCRVARSGAPLSAAGSAAAPDAEERRRLVFWQLWLVFFLA